MTLVEDTAAPTEAPLWVTPFRTVPWGCRRTFGLAQLSILSVPSTTRDTALNGFYIPKDRCVFINQWQVNHDE